MSFGTALTGLNAATADLDVTGNNIANSQTTGFKASRAEFADLFAISKTGIPRTAIGQGVRLAAVAQHFSQGQFSFTGNNLDLAIHGSGFFRLNDGGNVIYTRAGSYQLDREGFIVDNSGRRLTGYNADSSGKISGAIGDLRINASDVMPQVTTDLAMTANLKADSALPDQPFDPAATNPDPDTYNFSTSTTVYDSLGRSHLMTFYFVKEGDNDWTMYTRLDGELPATGDAQSLTFDSSGRLTSGAAANLTFGNGGVLAGADPLDIAPDLGKLSQFGTPFGVTQLSQNGYPAGQFSGLSIEPDGVIFARYSNGQATVLGQVALAEFPSPQNLQKIGNTSWGETYASGAPIVGTPGSSGLGQLQSGSLEQSNVNVTEQLVKMITAQRAYQANAKMISTQDQITQEILNIR